MSLLYGKFDANAYYAANPDVIKDETNAEQHWAHKGIAEKRPGYIVGFALGGQFDATGYLNCNPDVRNGGLDAKDHYKDCGWSEKRDICLWVDAVIEPSGTWLHLAKEGESFSITGTKTVRYGAATQWVVKEVAGAGQCTNGFFGFDPACGIAKSCQVMVSGPKPELKWSHIGAEGEQIILKGTRMIRYGAGTRWVMKLLSGAVVCTSAFFGFDPAPGITKDCEVLGPDAVKGTWQRIANEGQRFSIIGTQTLHYGDGVQWITKVSAGLGVCSAAAFGGDPAHGIPKYCEVWTPALNVSPVAVVEFDGIDDHVEVDEANIPSDAYTLEAWVKPDRMDGGIAGWGNHGLGNREIGLLLSNGGIVHHWKNSDLMVKTQSLVGKWHHVAATFDGSTRSVYLDGGLVGQDKPSRGLILPDEAGQPEGQERWSTKQSAGAAGRTDFRMGYYRRSQSNILPPVLNFHIGVADTNCYFAGQLAEIRLWDRARSRDEIVDEMGHRLVGDEPGLVGYWRLTNRGDVNEHLNGATWKFDDDLEQVIDPAYYYRLTTMWQGDGESLHILNDGRNNLPVLAGTADYASQYWKLTPLGKNYYRLTNRWLGPQKSFDIINDGVNNKPIMADTGNYGGQFLRLTLHQNGYLRITTQWQGEGKPLEVINDGQNYKLALADTRNFSGQFWKLTRTDVIVGDKDGIGLNNAPEFNGGICNTQSEGCLSQGCASQGTQGCAGQGCMAQASGCAAQGCPAQVQGCAAQGCIGQAEGCAAQGCAAQVQGCAGQGCIAQAAGCAAQGCAAQAEGCAAQGCAAQAEGCAAQACIAQVGGCAAQACAAQAAGCVAEGCAAQAEGCAAQGCAAQAEGCVAEGCRTQAEGCAAQGCAAHAVGCVAHGCAAQAEGCAAQGCAAQAEGCIAQGCAAQAVGCAAQGCAGQAEGCVAEGCAAQAGGCAAEGCAGDAACVVQGCTLDACAAHGCAGHACAADLGGPCGADGQLGPCAVDFPYCPAVL